MANFNAASAYPKMLSKLGNGEIFAGVKLESALLGSGKVPKKNCRGRDVVLNIKDQAATIAVTNDGGAVSHGSQTKTQLKVDPVTMIGGIELGVNLVEQTRDKEEAISHLEDEVETLCLNMGQDLNQLMVGEEIATAQAIAASGQADFTINEFASLAVGRSYDHLNSSGAKVQTITVSSIAWAADPDGPHTVTATANLSSATAVNDTFVLAGILNDGTDKNREFASLEKACNNATIYGQAAPNVYGWEGLRFASTGAFDIAELKQLEAKRRMISRRPLDFVVMNSLLEDAYLNSFFDSGAHYQPGGKLDVRDYSSSAFKNKPVILDETCGNRVFLVGKKCVELCEFQTFGITGMNSKSPPKDLTAFKAEGTHSYKLTVHGLYQMKLKSRKGIACLDGVDYT